PPVPCVQLYSLFTVQLGPKTAPPVWMRVSTVIALSGWKLPPLTIVGPATLHPPSTLNVPDTSSAAPRVVRPPAAAIVTGPLNRTRDPADAFSGPPSVARFTSRTLGVASSVVE